MKRLSWIGLALVAALAGCGRPADQAAAPLSAPPVTVERAGPIHWNATAGTFEFNGKPIKTAKLWTFEGSTEGFTTTASQIAPVAGQGLAIRMVDSILRSPRGLNVPGARYPLVLVRLTRTAAGRLWDGALYYATPGHPEATGFFGKPLFGAEPAVGETTTMAYDMSQQKRGAPDWSQSTIDEIRLDLEDAAGGAFVIRQIAIAENPDLAALAAFGPPPIEKTPKP